MSLESDDSSSPPTRPLPASARAERLWGRVGIIGGDSPPENRVLAGYGSAVLSESDAERPKRRSFPHRVHRLRTFGLALGAICVGTVLLTQGAALWLWWLLLAQACLWPHLALLLALRARDPHRVEFYSLGIDSLLGGFWVAVMGLNPAPSALLLCMLAMGKVAVGGPRLLALMLPAQILVLAGAWWLLGRPLNLTSSNAVLLGCLPLLIGYPLAVVWSLHRRGQESQQQNRRLAALNRTDTLTGVGNRSGFEEAAWLELRRHERGARRACLLLVDVDHFKAINDQHGHSCGDAVLRRVAESLRGSVRDIDTVARLGGDEFGVVLAETPNAEALVVAERIRAAVAAQVFEGFPDLRSTVSVGCAEIPLAGDALGWYERADRALYRAKAGGRNRVSCTPP